MGHQDKALVQCPCSRKAAHHGAPRTYLLLSLNWQEMDSPDSPELLYAADLVLMSEIIG